MPSFTTRVDVANRALQHVGASRIVSLSDDDKGAAEVAACIDNLREAELAANNWRFAIRHAVLYPIVTGITSLPDPSALPVAPETASQTLPTLLLQPPVWSANAVYDFGAIVQDSAGEIWQSTVPANVDNEPGVDGVMSWDTYFGSLCVTPYDASNDQGYYAGDLVYEATGGGQVSVYRCRRNGTVTDPSTGTPWAATTAYNQGDVVVDAAGYFWQSTVNQNVGNQPGVYGAWSSTPTYAVGALVIASDRKLYSALVQNQNVNPANGANPTDWSLVGNPGSWPMWNSALSYAKNTIVAAVDGKLYISYQASNKGNDPTTQPAFNPNKPTSTWWVPLGLLNPWTAAFATTTASLEWLPLDCTVTPLNVMYPIGSGPATEAVTKNVFKLPNGFLRKAPQDPKAGSISFLGGPNGRTFDDWNFEGDYIVSRTPYPIVLRFIADIKQVHKMDPMFCEGWAARIGMATCEILTQSTSKLAAISTEYKKFMDAAKTQNGILIGSVQPSEDDYVSCRM